MSLLAAQTTDNPWTETAMTTPRNSHSLTLLLDGRALAAGGWDGASPLAGAEIYDPRANAWQPASPLGEARVFHTASLLPDGRVLVAGGWNALSHALTTTEVYDPLANAWQPGPAMRSGRAGHTATRLPDGRVLVAGGYTEGGLEAAAELYDPVKNAWLPAGSLRTARAHHSATRLPDGRVLVVGGWDSANRPLISAELYDPTANAWTPAAALATARLDHTATLLPDGTVLVAGGYNGNYLASAEAYDPARDAWAAAGDLNVARAYHAAVLLRNGSVVVLGGLDGVRVTDSVETYNPQARAWTAAGRLDRAYASQLALLLGNDKVLLSGRPDSGDVTGNDGYPTPLPTPTPGPRTPGPLDWLLTPLPTATPRANQETGANSAAAFPASAAAAAAAAASVTIPNFSTGADDAGLYGVHEISFTLETVGDPYTVPYTITFTPQNAPGDAKTVMAFYDGTEGGQDVWKARVYANHTGAWTWTLPAGAEPSCPVGGCRFTAVELPSSGLHGMLRVSSSVATQGTPWAPTPGSPKRWYTDDGHTFLPMADTAYRLFFAGPTATLTPPPGTPISDPCPPVRDQAAFVTSYVNDIVSHGINVIRVEALGNWAYQDTYYHEGNPNRPYRSEGCEPDLSLFWSQAKDTGDALFDGPPHIGQLSGTPTPSVTPIVFYPNLVSFQQTDERLRQLLNDKPSVYVQMLLVPEPKYPSGDHTWLGISSTYRTQLWRTMIARWAAFPNVFWSISNDLGDTQPNYSSNIALADEVGNAFVGDGGSNCSSVSTRDPWCYRRPISMGHLRWQIDSSSGKSWHTYVIAYTSADVSAEEMDGPRGLHEATPWPYAATPKPVFNVEDQYEGSDGGNPAQKIIAYPDYYFRRLFWAYLLSGGGATYGSDLTYSGRKAYSEAQYVATGCSEPSLPPGTCGLHGLDDVKQISNALQTAHIDLATFKPKDLLVIPTPNSDWTEFNRAQVAARGKQEILAYIPNAQTVSPVNNAARRAITTTATSPSVTLNMTTFTDPNYTVTWYDPKTGITVTAGGPTPTPIPGSNPAVTLQAPSNLTGDAVVHISSRCTDPNKCQPMEADLDELGISESGGVVDAVWKIGIITQTITSTIHTDQDHSVFGNSWRCDDGKCRIEYAFPQGQSVASASFYFRRNTPPGSSSGVAGIRLSPSLSLVDGDGAEVGWITTHLYPDGDLMADQSVMTNEMMLYIDRAAPDLSRWYHLETRVERMSSNRYKMQVFLDGVLVFDYSGFGFQGGDRDFNYVIVYTETPADSSVWLDELSIDPQADTEFPGLFRAFLQQGLGGYSGTAATYFDYSGGYNNTSQLHVGANNGTKSLLHFDLTAIPATAVVDEAILQLYNTGRSNGNSLTLGAHGVLADWIDAEADRTQRKTDVNWNVLGMGSGSDYTAAAAATADITGAGNAWIDLNVTDLTQAWVTNPANNLGVVLLQEASSGYVIYSFCSELGWTPCAATQAPRLTLRYHLAPPPPVKATFQQDVNGYSGATATYFDYSGGYNNTSQLHVGADNSIKTLLRFDLLTIPITATVDEATLRLYQTGRSNGNTLALGAHRVLADWIDAEANRTQRETSVNWAVAGMGRGSDYVADADGTADLASAGGAWIDLDVKTMVQAWASNPDDNHGLVLTQEAASGYVYYNFCSELGWSPCTSAQAPRLTVWYH